MANPAEWNFFKGQKLQIFFLEDDIYFEGQFYSMNSERTRITLKKVTRYPDQRYFNDEYNFSRTEIKEIKAEKPVTGMEAVMDPLQGRSLAHYKVFTHAHLYRMSSQNIAAKAAPYDSIEQKKKHSKYPRYQKLLEDYIIIDKVDDLFRDVMDDFSKVATLAISLEGELLGRKGKLCWVNLASRDSTVLLDIQAMGQAAFDKGLKRVLQSEFSTKVMHDCRLACDMLLHQYSVKLVNVIDTQVLDVMILKNQHEKFPNYVSSLNDCLQRYLLIPKSLLFFPLIREHFILRDMKKWTERPLNQETQWLAVQNVVFLLDLRAAQLRTLVEPARKASELYTSLVAALPEPEATSYYGCIHMTPRVIQGKQQMSDGGHRMESLNPNIRFSRDVMHYFEPQQDSVPPAMASEPPTVTEDVVTKLVPA
ncbi:hypothetical protein B566_EDAN010132 [Ephemera danica]|nr:hypothetical protein B566_EDAN010132 [Ephemera danica]